MPKNVAGARRAKTDKMLDGAMAVIALVPSPKGVEVRLDNRAGLDDEDLAIAIREAADQLEGKHDRAKGMW
jgi:hypothetical protein